MAPGWTSLLWFAAIIAAIPAVLWLLKRTPVGGGVGGPAGTPRQVALLPLSASQRLVTVEVGQGEQRQWLVLGVTPQGITALHTMAPQTPAEGSPAQPPQVSFANLLQRLRHGGTPHHAP
jgi:flagellar protein FliO/FliZ